MKTVVFTAAPYGYGPTAKAISIAEELIGECESIFVGMEPGVSLARNSVFSRVIETADRDVWNSESLRTLAQADLLVSALDYRSLPLAAAHGVSSVFIDTLLWLRDEPPPHTELADAYIAQRFFQTVRVSGEKLRHKLMEVGPILPPRLDDLRIPRVPTEALDVVVNFGGLQSPAMRTCADLDYISLTASILSLGLPKKCRVRFSVPRYLQSIPNLHSDICGRFKIEFPTQNEFHALLEECNLLITTPGLETVYEAAATGVPIIFLPPYNATQLLQNRIYMEHSIGVHHVGLPYDSFGPISAKTLNRVTSSLQTQNALHVHNQRLVSKAGDQLAICLDAILADASVILSHVDRNHFLLRSLKPYGRKEAAQVIRERLGTWSPLLST